MNLIKQITIGDSGAQTIKMVVKSNERGPQGAQGVPGDAATLEAGNAYSIPEGQNPQVINTGTSSNAVFDFYLPKGPRGDDGRDGAIHYTAGTGINITDSNVIEATGAAIAAWGGIQGDIDDQTDLQTALQNTASTAETASKNYTDAKLEDYAKTTDIPTVNNATLTIQNNGTNVATFTANSSTNTTANIVPPVQIGSVLSTPTDVDYVNTANIADSAVTTAKIADSAVTSGKIDWTTLGSIAYRPGDSIPILYPCFAQITVLDDSAKAKLFIPLSKGSTASSVSFTSGGGGSSFGFVIDSANTVHAIYLQANQTVIGTFITGGVAFDVNLSSSAGTTYATGNLYMNDGSISFS